MNIWNTVVEDISEIPRIIREKTESLKSSFSNSALPSVDSLEGQIVYNTSSSKLYLRNATEFEELNSITKNRVFYKNLRITNSSAAITNKISVKADFISCNSYTIYGLDKTIDASVTGGGANLLDTGSLATNTWYAIYLIVDTGMVEPFGQNLTFDTLLSTNFTSPTLTWGAYDKYVRIGAVKTKSTLAEFRQFYQTDNITNYINVSIMDTPSDTDCNVLSSGSSTSFADVTNLSNSVPYAGSVFLSNRIFLLSNLSAGSTAFVRPNDVSISVGGIKLHGATGWNKTEVPINTTGLEYLVSGTTPTLNLYILGYVDTI